MAALVLVFYSSAGPDGRVSRRAVRKILLTQFQAFTRVRLHTDVEKNTITEHHQLPFPNTHPACVEGDKKKSNHITLQSPERCHSHEGSLEPAEMYPTLPLPRRCKRHVWLLGDLLKTIQTETMRRVKLITFLTFQAVVSDQG